MVKDFLYPESKDGYTKRPVNHLSLRAAVIYTFFLSHTLLWKLEEGKTITRYIITMSNIVPFSIATIVLVVRTK